MLLILTIPSFRAAEGSQVETVVNFKDSNLEQCVKSELSIDSGTISTSDLESLTSLSCSKQNISSLSGIEKATNLTSLNLRNNQLSDISSLSSLKKLRNLDISSNNITSITPLENLTALTSLKISDNQIQDIAIVDNFVNLERFEANSNKITDISSLSLLGKLQYLQLNHNQVTDISAISNLTKLSQLLLDDNQITLIPNLSNLVNLKQLSLSSNDISQLTDISRTNLTSLDVSNNQLTSLEQLGTSKTLEELDLSNNNLTDVDGINQLLMLENVDLSYNAIDNIDKIINNDNLVQVNLRHNKIEDISPLNSLSNLEELNLSQNKIVRASDFSNLENLQRLNLSENSINDLSDLEQLEGININAENQVIRLEPKNVDTNTQVSYIIKGLNAESYPINFDINKTGTMTYKKSWNSPRTNNYTFSGTVFQDITYYPKYPIVADNEKTIDEEQYYTDQQLISLFNVESVLNQKITVDQSKVNYSKPGKYRVIFGDEDLNQITVNVIVADVKPKLTTKVRNVVIDSTTEVIDYWTLYSPTGSELTTGDLNNKITIDDTAVDFEHPGTYDVIFKVKDEEGNSVNTTVTLTNTASSNDIIISTVDPDVSVKGDQVQINKYGAEGENLSGFEYTIYDEDGNIIEVITTDETGFAESNHLVPGHYYIEQTKSPANQGQVASEGDKATCEDSSSQSPGQCTTQSLSSPSPDLNQSPQGSPVSNESEKSSNEKKMASGINNTIQADSESGDQELRSTAGDDANNVFEKKDNDKNNKIIMLLLVGLLVVGIIFIFIAKVKKDE